MKSHYNGKKLDSVIYHERETDFSKVTAHPEFVLKGKTFHDETGQLKTGTAALSLTGVDTSDATATEDDVKEGATFYANGEKKTGTHKCPDTSDATATEDDVMAGATFYANGEKKTGTHVCAYPEKYDGAVIIKRHALSGTWLIDSEKLYYLLCENKDNVAQTMSFSAGVKGSDAGLIYYNSMTFDFSLNILQYSGDSGANAFTNMNRDTYADGWKDYPDGENGATINFDGEQNVSAEFYQLFTSIATQQV